MILKECCRTNNKCVILQPYKVCQRLFVLYYLIHIRKVNKIILYTVNYYELQLWLRFFIQISNRYWKVHNSWIIEKVKMIFNVLTFLVIFFYFCTFSYNCDFERRIDFLFRFQIGTERLHNSCIIEKVKMMFNVLISLVIFFFTFCIFSLY